MTLRMLLWGMLLGICGMSAAAQADQMTGQQLFDLCTKDGQAEKLLCSAYVTGFADGIVSGTASTLEMTRGLVCIPSKGIDNGKAITIAKAFVRDSRNRDMVGESARHILTVAMWKAFPCR